jgi:hypothetical protein
MEKRKQIIIIITGIFLMLFSFCWTFIHVKLFYDYHFTAKLFLIMLPDWILTFNALAGFAGMLESIFVIKNKLNPVIAIILSTILFLGLGVLDFYFTL